MMKTRFLIFLLFTIVFIGCHPKGTVAIQFPENASPRVQFGVAKLKQSLQNCGYEIVVENGDKSDILIEVGGSSDSLLVGKKKEWQISGQAGTKPESFYIAGSKKYIVVEG